MWYIKIYDFMITQLHLKGFELLVYAWYFAWQESGQTLNLNQGQVAEMLSMSRPQMSNIMKRLSDKGLVSYKNNNIVVTKFITSQNDESYKIYNSELQNLQLPVTKNITPSYKNYNFTINNNIKDNLKDNLKDCQIADATDGQKKSPKKPIEGDTKKEKLRKKKSPSIVTECRRHWEENYKQSKGVEYYYTAKDAAAVKQILDKIRFCMPEAERDHEDIVLANFKAFANAIFYGDRIDGWLRDNLSLSIINSKFNEIHNLLRNGKSRKDTNNGSNADDRRVSKDFLAELMRAAGGKV